MIVVVANRHDQSAQDIVARWNNQGAAMLTCEDLSLSGWKYHIGHPENSAAVVDGQVVPQTAITGVLTRRPCIFEEELLHIHPADRTYVAGEMHAFLVSWLSSLTCPVLNCPTPTCLSGPYWRTEQWTMTAARMGIPVRAAYRHISWHTTTATTAATTSQSVEVESCKSEEIIEVTVVGERCIGNSDSTLVRQARQLATAAGVDLLSVRFNHRDGTFSGVNLWPDLTDDITQAILELLQRKKV